MTTAPEVYGLIQTTDGEINLDGKLTIEVVEQIRNSNITGFGEDQIGEEANLLVIDIRGERELTSLAEVLEWVASLASL